MKSSYDGCEALYRNARAEEHSTPADRHAVRAALAVTVAAGIHTVATGALAASTTTALTATATKGTASLFLGSQFLTGLFVGTVIGTTVSVAAIVAIPSQSTPTTTVTAPPSTPLVVQPRSNVEHPIVAPSPKRLEKQTAATPPSGNNAQARVSAKAVAPEPFEPTRVQPPMVNAIEEAPGAKDPLLDEAQALSKVHEALSRQDPNAAWTLLEQQDQQFPAGQLTEERAAARVLALCSAGRTAEADQARSAFIATHPNSPLTSRVIRSCER